MNTPGNLRKARASLNVSEIFNPAPYVPDGMADPRHIANRDLYLECCGQVIREDDFKVHALMMPTMAGAAIVYAVDEEEGMADEVSALTGAEVNEGDMIVVLGRDLLEADFGENEMLEAALANIAGHINRIWPVADRTSGRLGRHIGWAATAGIIAGSHEVLRMLEPNDAVMDRIKDMAVNGIVLEIRGRTRDDRQAVLQNRPAMEAVENVCNQALETYGNYISLPATGADIAAAAKSVFLSAVDSMVHAPSFIL